MTAQTTTISPARVVAVRLSGALAAIREAAGGAFAAIRCAREVERLSLLSDAELARLGLARDQIVRHAFRDYLGR